MPAKSIVTPNRSYWLLAALALPLANVAALFLLGVMGGPLAFAGMAALVIAELAALAAALMRRGYSGPALYAWLAVGAGTTAALTAVYGIVALDVLFIV